jgi:hypothetical protein
MDGTHQGTIPKEKMTMTIKSISQKTLLLVILIQLLFVPAFAGTHNQATFTITASAKLAGVQLAPGDYLLKWQGEGEGAQVTILKNARVVATVTGTVKDGSSPNGTTVYADPSPDGSRVITRIDTSKKTLVFQSNTPAGSAGR